MLARCRAHGGATGRGVVCSGERWRVGRTAAAQATLPARRGCDPLLPSRTCSRAAPPPAAWLMMPTGRQPRRELSSHVPAA
jgi:hypothetical protein